MPVVPYDCKIDKVVFANYADTGSGDMIVQTNDYTIDLDTPGRQGLSYDWTSQEALSATVASGSAHVLDVDYALNAGQYLRGFVGPDNTSISSGQITLLCVPN
jgi:hypothetical protein